MSTLQNKKILVGITGGIAAYKSAELVRQLVQRGAEVRVVMTDGAQAFITPLTLQALSGNPVHTQLLDPQAEAGMGHIELAKWADLLIVAPASANFIARLTVGQADDLLTTVCLATTAPVAVAPAMNQAMWRNAATQYNCRVLADRGVFLWGPAEGSQACGDVGPGRMWEAQVLAERAEAIFTPGVLQGKTVIVTAGPTREALDPVRYLSNYSSGKMGYALAAAAQEAGARVFLVSGPTQLAVPPHVILLPVQTAEEMLAQCLQIVSEADIFIAAAAVADYRPAVVEPKKIKKDQRDQLQLALRKNPDIVATIAALKVRPFTIGFAAETDNLLEFAKAKMLRKNLDGIIANDVSHPGIGFNSDRNAVWAIDSVETVVFPEAPKQQLARDLIQWIAKRFVSNLSKTPRGK